MSGCKTACIYGRRDFCAGCAAVSIVFLSSEKKKELVWAETGLVLAGFLVTYLWNAWGYKWTAFVFLLPFLVPLIMSLKGAEEAEYQHLWVYLAVLSIILYSKFSESMVSSVSDEDIAQRFAGLNAQQVNLADLNAYLKTFSARNEMYRAQALSKTINDRNTIASGAIGEKDKQIFDTPQLCCGVVH